MIIIFLYLVKEGLSFLQLFLGLPETIWELRKLLYTKKSRKTAVPINTHIPGYIFARYMSFKGFATILRINLTSSHVHI